MTAEAMVKALGGRKTGNCWMAKCPGHDDRSPSLSIYETADCKVLVRCHAGCDQDRVILALRSLGLWPNACPASSRGSILRSDSAHKASELDTRRIEVASSIWNSSKPANGSLVEVYLASRAIRLKPPDSLRFHAGLKHPSGGFWPVMVSRVESGADGAPLAIHRTFLARDGKGKAPVSPQRMMLGPCRGGAVRLAEPNGLLMVGEGIETCLAAMMASGHPAWAALSTSGLRTLELPTHVRDVIVLADGDDAGETAAQSCARRWTRQGRCVRIARPPRGMDFNDLLLGRTSCIEEGAS